MSKMRLGDLLLNRGLVTKVQLEEALTFQRQRGVRLGIALVEQKAIAEGMLTRALSESFQIPMVDLTRLRPDDSALKLLDDDVCARHDILPLTVKGSVDDRVLLLAMADPLNQTAIDEASYRTGIRVRPAIAQISSLRAAIRRYYLGESVDIPPLNFHVLGPAPGTSGEFHFEQVVTSGQIEEVVPEDEYVIDLTQEVEDAESHLVDGKTRPDDVVQIEAAASTDFNRDHFRGAPSGAYVLAKPVTDLPTRIVSDDDILAQLKITEADSVDIVEKRLWALIRLLTKKGVITREEFFEEIQRGGGRQ